MKRTFVCRGRYQSPQRYTVTVDQHLQFETMRFFFFFARDSDFAIHRESLSRHPKRWIGEHSKHRADLDAPERRR